MKGFTKCTNGHYYKEELPSCPYCPAGAVGYSDRTQVSFTSAPTEVGDKTEIYGGFSGNQTKTTDFDETMVMPGMIVGKPLVGASATRTVFGDEFEMETPGGREVVVKEYRSSRKLVGWLVTYSFDKMGVDYKLYEGRNTIGRDLECNITVNDPMMSGKHATLLFRSDKYKLKDEMSSHGTFVNNHEIDDENFTLTDGDIIKMGEAIFKFRSSF